MQKNFEVTEFEDISHLEAIMLRLPTARLEDVQVAGEDAEHYKAVVNDDTKEIETICSDKYNLINHREILEPVVKALRNLGIGVKGKVIVDKGRVYADVFFNDERLSVDVSQERKLNDIVNFGMRFFNSYDKTTSFGAEVIAMRLVCLNGMVKPIALKSIHEIHTGDNKLVVKSIAKLFTTLCEESPKFFDIVDRARKEIVTMKMLEELLTGWKLGEKHIKSILEKAEKADEMNSWDVYNFLTDTISHELQVREKTRETWHRKYANQVLTVPIPEILARRKIAGA